MYSERPSTVAGAVVWRNAIDGPVRVLPDGCMDLIRMDGDIVVAGPDTRPYETHGRPGERYIGLRFPPGVLPDLLGIPAVELRDARVPLLELSRAEWAKALVESVAGAAPADALESFVQAHLNPAPDPRTSMTVRSLIDGASVFATADRVNLSERQLHRWSLRQFGYGPKTLARILRFQAALRVAESATSGAVIAAQAGYADQAHLIRETQDLAGASFAALVTS